MPTNSDTGISWTIEDIYDLVMERIEPDLVHANIPELDNKYKNETPEETAARGERYAEAIAECFRQMDRVMEALKGGYGMLKERLATAVREESALEDAETIKHIESLLEEHDQNS